MGSARTTGPGTDVVDNVDRRYSSSDHLSSKPRPEPRYPLPFSCKGWTPQIEIQGVGGYRQTGCRFVVDLTETRRTRKEDIIGGPGKTTAAKRDREKARLQKQRDKEERRAQRKAAKLNRPMQEGEEDPDLAGLQWGPQPPLF